MFFQITLFLFPNGSTLIMDFVTTSLYVEELVARLMT